MQHLQVNIAQDFSWDHKNMNGYQVQHDKGQMFSGEQFEENGSFLYNYGE